MAYRQLSFESGVVEYIVSGPADASGLLLFHPGTPSAAVEYPGLTEAAAAAGLRVASYSRPGYGSTTRRAGRGVADEVRICAALADQLGYEAFLTVGWSGGGPVALACAALLPDRVRACMAMASIAPQLEVGSAWESWIPPDQLPEWNALRSGDPASLIADFEDSARIFRRITARRLRSVGGPPDARNVALHGAVEIAPHLVRSMRRAVSRGYFGYLDDSIAQARDWGFRVASIRVPVVVRHGELDRVVSVENGRWLAATIPGARGVFVADAGHGSVALPWSELVADLVGAAAGRLGDV